MEIHTDILAGLLTYLVVMVAVGIWASRRVKNQEDFLLGGRKLGPWVSAISERASGESAWFLMGLPGAAYAVGFREFWSVIGIAFGIFISWIVIAKPLRVATAELGAMTVPDYFARRFPEHARPIRALGAIALVFFYIFYLGAQILGAGKLFRSILGWESLLSGALLGAAVVCAYTLLGGFLAVAVTDLIQGLMMMAVAVLLPLLMVIRHGVGDLISAVQLERPAEFFAMTNASLDHAVEGLGFGAIIGGLAWGLGYLGQPHLLTRYMAIRDPREMKRATSIAMGWVLTAYWGVAFAGIFAVPALGGDLADPDLVIAHLASTLLPGWIAGVVIAGILAAIMSSADSQLLVATSSVVEDFLRRVLKVDLTPTQIVWLSRWSTIALTLIAIVPLFSTGSQKFIYAIVAYAWAGLGSTFGPALILALWWRGATGAGVLAGMVVGLVSTVLWKNVQVLDAIVDLKVASFLLAVLAVVVGSLASKPHGPPTSTSTSKS